MRRIFPHMVRKLGVFALVAMLLLPAWPHLAEGQGSQLDEEMQRFLETRIRQPGSFPHYPLATPENTFPLPRVLKRFLGENVPAAPGVDPSHWSGLTFDSYRDLTWEIYSADGDGSNPNRRTHNTATDVTPEFNRGATQIVFISARDGNYEVYRMDADGSNQTRLTWTSANEYLPTWSSDGTRIAFYSYRDNNAEIYVMNADGSNQTRLTSNPAWDGHPTWSPDDSKIAFVSERGGNDQIWVMNADGSNQQQLTSGLNYPCWPDWSPDGSRLILSDDYNNDGWLEVAIVNADGTGLILPGGVSAEPYDFVGPVWAPQAEDAAFAFVEWIYYNGQWYWVVSAIFGVDLENETLYPLADSGYDWFPDWQPTDISAPSSQVQALPPWSGDAFTVQWSGSDSGGAGLRSFDVQYRDGAGAQWADWLLDTDLTGAEFTGGQEGHTYCFRTRARDHAFNLEPYPGADGDTCTTVDVTPPTSSAFSPEYSADPVFPVSWSGSDAVSGVASYDLMVRDGSGPWNTWLEEATATEQLFTGQPGHTYCFQSRARDNAGHLEDYPWGDGDSCTHVATYVLPGHVLGNRDQPVAFATVEATPPALNTAHSGPDGGFSLFFNGSGAYAVAAWRDGFGALPPMQGVWVGASMAAVTFYLPPVDDCIANGGFETGDLASWQTFGEITATITETGHTGDCAAMLGGPAAPPLVTPTVPFSGGAVLDEMGGQITSPFVTVVVPPDAVSGTVTFTISSVPTVAGLPAAVQDVGPHFSLTASLLDGTPVVTTSHRMTFTVSYSDTAWQAAQVSGEETLSMWWYDPDGGIWMPLSGTVDMVTNTLSVATPQLGLFALVGEPYGGPWSGVLEQEVELPPTLVTGTLSLLYRVKAAEPTSDTLLLILAGPTQDVTYTLPLTIGEWVHRWWEMPAWAGPTLTVRLEWAQGQRDHPPGVIVDEVSLGTAAAGSYGIYLPLLLRER